ncbi:MAG: anthranilate synthase component 1 [Gammaproteobacteria bacterium]
MAARIEAQGNAPRRVALSRRLPLAPDPLGLYVLAGHGAKGPRALFETADAGARESAESLIFLDPAASLVARGNEVRLTAHDSLGAELAGPTTACLGMPAAGRGSNTWSFRYPAAAANPGDEASRLREPSVLDPLRALMFESDFDGGDETAQSFAFGCFGYDLLDAFEPLPAAHEDPTDYPDYSVHLAGSVIRIDHRHACTTISVLAPANDTFEARRRLAVLAGLCARAGRPAPAEMPSVQARCSQTDADYAAVVERCKGRIAAGDVYQIVPSRVWKAPCTDPLAAYARLRAANPSPYQFYLDEPAGTLFGASPESALKVDATSRRVEIRPIAGTRPRGEDAESDTRLELELRLSEKELAEHSMLVDLARNDIARVAAPGTRRVSELMQVERYSRVMHLVSRVEGTLAPGLDALHAYRATLNMGTLTGAPKLRAAQLLRALEPGRRGPYGGAVGYLTGRGDLDTAIVIRSAFVRDGVASVQAGAGIVADSEPLAEAEETRRKAQAVLAALGAGEGKSDE